MLLLSTHNNLIMWHHKLDHFYVGIFMIETPEKFNCLHIVANKIKEVRIKFMPYLFKSSSMPMR